jgi:hypothetical protein
VRGFSVCKKGWAHSIAYSQKDIIVLDNSPHVCYNKRITKRRIKMWKANLCDVKGFMGEWDDFDLNDEKELFILTLLKHGFSVEIFDVDNSPLDSYRGKFMWTDADGFCMPARRF